MALIESNRNETNPRVMLGKPVIRGTRIPVELIVRKLAEGASEEDLIDGYPRLTREDIEAAVRYEAGKEIMSVIDRITTSRDICGGRPCVRDLRIRVKDVLELLAAGATREEILADYPYLEDDDITAVLEFAAREAS